MNLISPALAASLMLTSVNAVAADPPADWYLAGSNPQDYTVSLDRSGAHTGTASALIASKADTAQGFGTLMQTAQGEGFKGKRVKFSAYIKTKDVKDWAGLWFRVDGTGSSPLAFDNMYERSIKGTSQWQPYSIVLDVPDAATAIAYGVLLNGSGSVWIDSARFEVVPKSVPTSGKPKPALPAVPVNLDFEQ